MNRSRVARPKLGKRADLDDQFFRSAMEADVARVLDVLVRKRAIKGWAFEPETFTFAGLSSKPDGPPYKVGPWAYTPDFLIHHYADYNLSGRAADYRALWRDCLARNGVEQAEPTVVKVPRGARWHGTAPEKRLILGQYVEVKGREQGSDRSKRKRLAKHYPDVAVVQVGRAEFFALATIFAREIPLWESKIRTPRHRRTVKRRRGRR